MVPATASAAPQAEGSVQNPLNAQHSSHANIHVAESTDDSARFEITKGRVSSNPDGTVTIVDSDGTNPATLPAEIMLSNGKVTEITYSVEGNVIEAKLSVPIVSGKAVPVRDRDAVTCALETAGTIGAIGSIPLTGGASAAILGGLVGGSAAGLSVYDCIKSFS